MTDALAPRQALADNARELARCAAAVDADGYRVGGADWLVDDSDEDGWHAGVCGGVLHCVDDLSHEHTTADAVERVATELGIHRHLRIHVADAYDLADTWPDSRGDLGMIWLDFGAGTSSRLRAFLSAWWPRIKPGGLLLVHSTLTNQVAPA